MDENDLSKAVIGAAIEVHRHLGPGLLESVYEEALCHEQVLHNIAFERQKPVPLRFKGVRLATDLKLDLIAGEKLIIELKSKEIVTDLDRAQLLTYPRLCDLSLGLIINFNVPLLRNGISRVVNQLPE
jgi:GxxExxY protein